MSTSCARRLDIELHQVDQRRAAGDEAHVRALLRRLRLRRDGDRRRGIVGPNELEGLHGARLVALQLRASADLLDGRDDVRVGAAAADVAAHQFLHVGVVGPHGSLSNATADMIWPDVQ